MELQQLQPSLIDNEYVRAVTAHSTYFFQTDIVDFLIDITNEADNEIIDLTEDDDDEDNEEMKDAADFVEVTKPTYAELPEVASNQSS